jgi:pimeloyl-ACP methyl ester carboxylesterase
MPAPWLAPEWRPPASSHATVVFVHGALVRGYEMALMRRRFRSLGYHVRQFRYASMLRGLDDNARRLKAFLTATPGDTLHVVGHSMGGVLIRRVFEHEPDPRPGRLVAIGSPLVNCWIGHRVHGLHAPFGRWMVGRTVAEYIARAPGDAWLGARDFGVLAGTYPVGIGRLFQPPPNPSDGVILVEETRLPGITDHVAYRLNHFALLVSRHCCAQVARFLATGCFAHGEESCVERVSQSSHRLPQPEPSPGVRRLPESRKR